MPASVRRSLPQGLKTVWLDVDGIREGDDYTSVSMEYYVTGRSYDNEIEFYSFFIIIRQVFMETVCGVYYNTNIKKVEIIGRSDGRQA